MISKSVLLLVLMILLIGCYKTQEPESNEGKRTNKESDASLTLIISCDKITSTNNIEKCVEQNIIAIGILECNLPAGKGSLPKLTFEDQTALFFGEPYSDCESDDNKNMKFSGWLHQCREFDQCMGMRLTEIEYGEQTD